MFRHFTARSLLSALVIVIALAFAFHQVARGFGPLVAAGLFLSANFAAFGALGGFRSVFGARLTLLDVAKMNGSDGVVGLVEESISYAPEFGLFPVRTISGTSFKTLHRTGLPAVDFIAASSGIAASKSTFENKLFECAILGGRIEVWKSVLDSPENGTPADIKATEASGVMEAAIRKVGRQVIYGKTALGSANGFVGLVSFVDSSMIVDATGTSPNTGSSVYFVKFGPKFVELVMGKNGEMSLSDFRVESLTDADGNKGPGEVADLCSWVGLQQASKHSVVRIKNLTADSGKGCTDALLAAGLAKFPTGIVPDLILMSRRSRTQLQTDRASRTALRGTGKNDIGGGSAYVPTPTDFEGIQIVATDSILDTEPIA